jgi:hypothetical protein
MKCVTHASSPNVTNFPIPCPQASLQLPFNLSFQMCGVMLVLPLIIFIIMFALWMISANSTCLNTNLKFFISFKSFSPWLSACLIVKFLLFNLIEGGVSKAQFFFFRKVGISHHVSCPYAHQQNVLDKIGLHRVAMSSYLSLFRYLTHVRLINMDIEVVVILFYHVYKYNLTPQSHQSCFPQCMIVVR